MTNQGFLPFQELTGCHKALYTMTLLILGTAYLFAMIQTFSVHASRDGNFGLSPNDLVLAYSGSSEGTRLEAAIKGPMSGMLHEEDVVEIVAWIQDGAESERYQDKVAPIMEEHCFNCHGDNEQSRASYPHNPILEGYSNAMKMVQIDTGADVLTLIRVSHIHLFGMTFIFFIVGGIFLHAYVQPACVKCIILITPFIAIMVDIFSWYLTKIYEPFAWVIYLSGVFMALSFAAQWIISMYQMWFYKLPRDNMEGSE
jgi:hypothetical protein